MPKTRKQKEEALKGLKSKLADSKAVVFTSDTGLTVKEVEALRKELRANDSEYYVAKKTLLKKALENVKEEDLKDLAGSFGVTFSFTDEVSAAKAINKVAKNNEKFNIAGGVLEKDFILPEMVKKLASIPSKEELLAKLVGSLKSPITGVVGVLGGNLRNLVGVLAAIKDKKE